MNANNFVLGLVQMAMNEDVAANLKHGLTLAAEAAKQGAQVICLPELFASHYFCQREDVNCFDLAEPLDGPTAQSCGAFAAQHGVALLAPFFERRAPGVYHNSVLVFDADGTCLGVYRKMHIPDDPAYYEKFYFTPGDLGFKSFSTRFGVIAPLICWDQWYPEAARLATLNGAVALVYPTAIGWHPHEKEQYGERQYDAWLTAQRGHAVANGVYVAAANRVGFERCEVQAGIEFWGASFVADPQGVVIARASHDKEETLIAEVDVARLETVRRNWPFLRDRRIDAYSAITRRFLDEGTAS